MLLVLAGPHSCFAIDDVWDTTSRFHHLFHGLRVENSGNVEVVIELVSLNCRLQELIKHIIISMSCMVTVVVKVTELLEILPELVDPFYCPALLTPLEVLQELKGGSRQNETVKYEKKDSQSHKQKWIECHCAILRERVFAGFYPQRSQCIYREKYVFLAA